MITRRTFLGASLCALVEVLTGCAGNKRVDPPKIQHEEPSVEPIKQSESTQPESLESLLKIKDRYGDQLFLPSDLKILDGVPLYFIKTLVSASAGVIKEFGREYSGGTYFNPYEIVELYAQRVDAKKLSSILAAFDGCASEKLTIEDRFAGRRSPSITSRAIEAYKKGIPKAYIANLVKLGFSPDNIVDLHASDISERIIENMLKVEQRSSSIFSTYVFDHYISKQDHLINLTSFLKLGGSLSYLEGAVSAIQFVGQPPLRPVAFPLSAELPSMFRANVPIDFLRRLRTAGRLDELFRESNSVASVFEANVPIDYIKRMKDAWGTCDAGRNYARCFLNNVTEDDVKQLRANHPSEEIELLQDALGTGASVEYIKEVLGMFEEQGNFEKEYSLLKLTQGNVPIQFMKQAFAVGKREGGLVEGVLTQGSSIAAAFKTGKSLESLINLIRIVGPYFNAYDENTEQYLREIVEVQGIKTVGPSGIHYLAQAHVDVNELRKASQIDASDEIKGKTLLLMGLYGLKAENVILPPQNDKPDAVIVCPLEDQNEVWLHESAIKIGRQFAENYNVYLVVAEKETQVYSAVQRLCRARGSKTMELLILGGHGGVNKDGENILFLGETEKYDASTEEMYLDPGDEELTETLECLKPGGTVFLNCCSAAKRIGGRSSLADSTWEKMPAGTRLIAARESFSPAEIRDCSVYPFDMRIIADGNDVTYRRESRNKPKSESKR